MIQNKSANPEMILDGVEDHIPLSNFTTFGIGGPARHLKIVKSVEEMVELHHMCLKMNIRYFILGKGSNCLFDDRGFDGLVIVNRIDFLEKPTENTWYVGAGYSFSYLGIQTARLGWGGLEFASGIPGSVGGAIYMNAGANGSETANSLISVDYLNEEGEIIRLDRSEIVFGNRYSTFQKRRGVILGGVFQLTPSENARQHQLDLFHYRKQTQPFDAKCAGCVFKNPPNGHAGAIIDQLGLKGNQFGEAQISPKHANFIVNQGKASSQDVKNLIAFIQNQVKEKTEYELELEVRLIHYQASLE